jgi:hypothetical protein
MQLLGMILQHTQQKVNKLLCNSIKFGVFVGFWKEDITAEAQRKRRRRFFG